MSYLETELEGSPKDRPVYILGESFGGLLALAVGMKCPNIVHRLVLVNPATSFQKSVWPRLGPLLKQLPDELYKQILPLAVSPLISNPVALASGKTSKEFVRLINMIRI